MKSLFKQKRRVVLFFIFALFILVSILLVVQRVFRAEEIGISPIYSLKPITSYDIKGTISDRGNGSILNDVQILLLSLKPAFKDKPQAALTDLDGNFFLSGLDVSYTQIIISKNGYQSIAGLMSVTSSDMRLYLNLAPGQGSQEAQVVPLNFTTSTVQFFGLAVQPQDSFPGALDIISQDGKQGKFSGSLWTDDLKSNTNVRLNADSSLQVGQIYSLSLGALGFAADKYQGYTLLIPGSGITQNQSWTFSEPRTKVTFAIPDLVGAKTAGENIILEAGGQQYSLYQALKSIMTDCSINGLSGDQISINEVSAGSIVTMETKEPITQITMNQPSQLLVEDFMADADKMGFINIIVQTNMPSVGYIEFLNDGISDDFPYNEWIPVEKLGYPASFLHTLFFTLPEFEKFRKYTCRARVWDAKKYPIENEERVFDLPVEDSIVSEPDTFEIGGGIAIDVNSIQFHYSYNVMPSSFIFYTIDPTTNESSSAMCKTDIYEGGLGSSNLAYIGKDEDDKPQWVHIFSFWDFRYLFKLGNFYTYDIKCYLPDTFGNDYYLQDEYIGSLQNCPVPQEYHSGFVDVSVEAGYNSAILNFTWNFSSGEYLTLRYRELQGQWQEQRLTDTSATVSGLKEGTEYEYQIIGSVLCPPMYWGTFKTKSQLRVEPSITQDPNNKNLFNLSFVANTAINKPWFEIKDSATGQVINLNNLNTQTLPDSVSPSTYVFQEETQDGLCSLLKNNETSHQFNLHFQVQAQEDENQVVENSKDFSLSGEGLSCIKQITLEKPVYDCKAKTATFKWKTDVPSRATFKYGEHSWPAEGETEAASEGIFQKIGNFFQSLFWKTVNFVKRVFSEPQYDKFIGVNESKIEQTLVLSGKGDSPDFEVNKTYDYQIDAFTDPKYIDKSSDNKLFRLGCAEISNVQAAPETTTATISWNTDIKTTGLVEYGKTTDYGNTAADEDFKTEHSVDLAGLEADTTYHYRIKASDKNDHPDLPLDADAYVYSEDMIFITKGSSSSPTPIDSPTVSPATSPTISPKASPMTSPTTSPTISPTTSPITSPTISPATSPTTSPTTSPSPTSSSSGTIETTCKVDNYDGGMCRVCYYSTFPNNPDACTGLASDCSYYCSSTTCLIPPNLLDYLPCISGIYDDNNWCVCTPPEQGQPTQKPLTITTNIIEGTSGLVEYGTRKDKYTNTLPLSKIEGTVYAAQIPNPKSRTYHYRIVTTDEDGKTTYSDDKTVKYGNRFFRFFNDLFGNFWAWLKERF